MIVHKMVKIVIYICLCNLLAACVTAIDEALPYDELPSITIATEVKLVASSAHPTAYLSSDKIPAGEKVQVIGTDKNAAWLLVLYKSQLGWMPSIFSRDNVGTLNTALVVEPLADNCAEYLDAIVAPDEAWESNTTGAVIVAGSIYRPQTSKQFDDATLAIQIDGNGTVIDADYMHTPLTPTSAVILFAYSLTNLQKGDQISFDVSNPSNEPLSFQAAFFRNDCPQDLVRLPIGKTRVVVAEQFATPTDNAPASTQQASTFTPTQVIVKPEPHPTVTPKTNPFDVLSGRWVGPVHQAGSRSYSLEMILNDCTLQAVCGSIQYPELSCGGSLTFLKVEGVVYRFTEKIEFGRNGCGDNGTITLEHQGGTWVWNWYYPDGRFGASAILTQSD